MHRDDPSRWHTRDRMRSGAETACPKDVVVRTPGTVTCAHETHASPYRRTRGARSGTHITHQAHGPTFGSVRDPSPPTPRCCASLTHPHLATPGRPAQSYTTIVFLLQATTRQQGPCTKPGRAIRYFLNPRAWSIPTPGPTHHDAPTCTLSAYICCRPTSPSPRGSAAGAREVPQAGPRCAT